MKNIMEDIVAEKLDEVIGTLGCCTCGQCRSDIISYALNRLKPKYANTELGAALAKVDTLSHQFEVDVLTAIYDGAETVSKNPRHAKA